MFEFAEALNNLNRYITFYCTLTVDGKVIQTISNMRLTRTELVIWSPTMSNLHTFRLQ